MQNLFDDIPASLPDELVETLLKTSTMRIERIVSDGHRSPPDFWYDQTEAEWVVVLQGSACLRMADPEQVIELHAGDFLNIPARRRHRVESVAQETQTIWLAVFYQP